ncbi:MAG TPA: ZIP family metal transporter [Candidatus Thalassarchaeum sp.]|jgi:zinc transporter 9|nr:ZIP family metal transporter [Candidatus Thalassarchaeum sp.]
MVTAGVPIELAALTLILALIGGLFPIFSKVKENPETLRRITGIASGILLASALLVVVPEGFELATGEHEEGGEDEEAGHEEEGVGNLLIGGAVLAGFLMMLILEGSGIGHAVHEEHHDHHDEHGHEHVHHRNSPWIIVLGLSLHSAADGLAIGSAAAGTSEAVTALVALAVLIHKVPAAFSLGVFSMHERENKNDSIKDIVIFSLATPVMILVSFYTLQGMDEHLIALAMLFAAGTFLYVATVDTLPDIHNPETGREALRNVLIGVVVLVLLLYGAEAAGLIEHGH